MGEFLTTVGEFADSAPVLSRVLFASLQLCVLAPLLALAIKARVIRSHRMQSLLWLILLADALLSITFRAPVDLAVLHGNARDAVPLASAGPDLSHVPRLRDPRRVAPEPGGAAPALGDVKSALAPPAGVTPPRPARQATPGWWRGVPASVWLGAIWLCGVGLLLANLALERWRLFKLLRRTQAPSPALLACYRAESGGAPSWWWPALRVTGELETPAIVGVVRPVILVPRWLEQEGTEEQWTWTLRHELTHWRHGDTIGQMVRLIAQSLFFFHPLVWWAGKRWEEAAELACDRSLLKTEQDAVGYARELCELLGMIGKRQRPLMSAGLFASRSHIGRRIETLLADPFARPGRLVAWQRAAAAALLLVLAGVDLSMADSPPAAAVPGVSVVSSVAAAAPGDPGARVLEFPDAYSMGTLRIDGETVEAQGTVNVPAGAQVQFRANDAGAADLSPLAGFAPDALDSIYLRGAPVQDEQMVYLAGLTGLRDLDIERTPIGDAGMANLGALVNLEELNLDGTLVGDAGMAYVEGMQGLRDLELNRSLVTDEGLYYIRNLTGITHLDMWMLDITDEGMQYLAGLENLYELGIEDTLITDAGLRHLEGLAHLDGINLENNNITDAGLESLARIQNLTRIALADTYLSDAGMAILARFPRLQMALLPVQIGPEGLKHLEGTAVGNFVAGEAGNRRAVSVRLTGEGRPLPDAHFMLVENPGPGEEVHVYRTGADGSATLYLPAGSPPCRLRGFAQGYVTGEKAWPAPSPEVLALDLERATYIGGAVVDGAGTAVPGVAVSIPVLGGHNWDAAKPLPHSVSTDENGRWTCDVAPRDMTDFWISLEHPEYATTTYTAADLPLAALRDGTAVLTISEPIGLAGVVVNTEGAPVAGARIVELERWRQYSMRATGRSATTDGGGGFAIPAIQPGESILQVTASGYATKAETATVAAGMEPVRIVLARPGALRGRVVNEEGEYLGGIRVSASAQSEEDVRLGRYSGTTDDEGRFVWDEAPDAPISLSFYRENGGSVRGGEYHNVPNVRAGEEEQVFTVPFASPAAGVAEGQALIDRYNEAHSIERMGDVAFVLQHAHNLNPDQQRTSKHLEGIWMADGRFRELVNFDQDGAKGPPWRHTWNGTIYVRGDSSEDKNGDSREGRFFVGDQPQSTGFLTALRGAMLFVDAESPTVRYEVMGYEDGLVTLGDDGIVTTTILFSDTDRLFYERVEHFNEDGNLGLRVEAKDWSESNGIAYPKEIQEWYDDGDIQGESTVDIEFILRAAKLNSEDFTLAIPWEPGVNIWFDSGQEFVEVTQLDEELIKAKAYVQAGAGLLGE